VVETARVSDLDMAALRALTESGPTPLFATVSGAHLYGFASGDSDVDLRGAYVMPLSERLALVPPAATITLMDHERTPELDWVAHDVHKFATLMTKRNGYVLEQLYSPLVVVSGAWHEELCEIGRGCVVRHLHHHYRGFAAGQRRELERDDATVKTLLYAYRVLLTGIHVLRTGEICADLPNLADVHGIDGVGELIARKREGAEHGALDDGEVESHGPRLDALEAQLQEAFEASGLPDEPTTRPALSDFVVRASRELGA
jgi:predicted nucleotidyltransferase